MPYKRGLLDEWAENTDFSAEEKSLRDYDLNLDRDKSKKNIFGMKIKEREKEVLEKKDVPVYTDNIA